MTDNTKVFGLIPDIMSFIGKSLIYMCDSIARREMGTCTAGPQMKAFVILIDCHICPHSNHVVGIIPSEGCAHCAGMNLMTRVIISVNR